MEKSDTGVRVQSLARVILTGPYPRPFEALAEQTHKGQVHAQHLSAYRVSIRIAQMAKAFDTVDSEASELTKQQSFDFKKDGADVKLDQLTGFAAVLIKGGLGHAIGGGY